MGLTRRSAADVGNINIRLTKGTVLRVHNYLILGSAKLYFNEKYTWQMNWSKREKRQKGDNPGNRGTWMS